MGNELVTLQHLDNVLRELLKIYPSFDVTRKDNKFEFELKIKIPSESIYYTDRYDNFVVFDVRISRQYSDCLLFKLIDDTHIRKIMVDDDTLREYRPTERERIHKYWYEHRRLNLIMKYIFHAYQYHLDNSFTQNEQLVNKFIDKVHYLII